MLAALSSIRSNAETPHFSLRCLHVEHGIRPPEESKKDAEFVKEFCEKLDISCRIVSISPGKIASLAKRDGLGIEAAARFFRHRALLREAGRLESASRIESEYMKSKVRILIGHTKDDMLETALMRVLRGCGPQGLSIMPVNRRRILRPLLQISRAEALEYLSAKKIPWREDSTNMDSAFLRNRIRHKLIPVLNESFPSWKKSIAAMAATQTLVSDFIQNEAACRVNWEKGASSTCLSTGSEVFFAQNIIVREEAVFRGINILARSSKIQNTFQPRRSSLRRFCTGQVKTADLGPLLLKHEKGRVFLSVKEPIFFESGFSLLIKQPGLYILKGINIEVRPFSKFHAPGLSGHSCFYASLPFVLRPCFKDDFFVSAGRITRLQNLIKTRRQNFVSVVDSYGTAAFIGPKGILLGRDAPPPEAGEVFSVLINKDGIGGIDV